VEGKPETNPPQVEERELHISGQKLFIKNKSAIAMGRGGVSKKSVQKCAGFPIRGKCPLAKKDITKRRSLDL